MFRHGMSEATFGMIINRYRECHMRFRTNFASPNERDDESNTPPRFWRPRGVAVRRPPASGGGAGEVLVKVYAASLNPPDLYLRDGYRALPPEWRPMRCSL
jgi:hypothetical protein